MCPRGYYLGGLERSGGQNLHNIERARCCKPRNQPSFYKDCYKENVWSKFDHHNSGMVSCGRNGYYITGLYRSNCDLLYCVEEFMCCSMLSAVKGKENSFLPYVRPVKLITCALFTCSYGCTLQDCFQHFVPSNSFHLNPFSSSGKLKPSSLERIAIYSFKCFCYAI